MGFGNNYKIKNFVYISYVLIHLIAKHILAEDYVITAHISENDLQGVIYFKKNAIDDIVTITTFIKTLQPNNTDSVSWNIRQLPVEYSVLQERCSNRHLGSIRQDLDSMFGRLRLNKEVEFSVSTNILSLTGPQGIWQSSILLELPDGKRACSTLVPESTDIRIGKSKFYGPIFGTIYFFWIGITGSETDAVVISDLQHVHKNKILNTNHKWGIYVTDILETKHDKRKMLCNALQLAYNSLNDLSPKFGKLQAGRKAIYRDSSLAPIDLYQEEHTYYAAVYDDVHKNTFLSCSPIVLSPELVLKSHIEGFSNKANITLSQASPFNPTKVAINMSSSGIQSTSGIRIHSLPIMPFYYEYNSTKCHGVGDVYNPTNKGIAADAPFPGNNTQDMYAVGDLSGKFGYLVKTDWDIFLPLFGPHSVLHRTMAIYRNTPTGIEVPWLCEILAPFVSVHSDIKAPMATAEVIFQYPISGRILFRQLADQEFSDTVVIVESLLYSDGSGKVDTFHHNWTINENPPGKDYYSWQDRCVSAGTVYNSFKLSEIENLGTVNNFNYAQLASILGTLSVVARKVRVVETTRKFFVHPNLPIVGSFSVIGKSLVIYDENGPKARGNRLACSKILPVNRRKAVVRDWFGNGEPIGIMGDIEMYQMSEYDTVDIEIDVEGLHEVNEYHIHMVPVNEELEFPCENSSLFDVWNPLNAIDNFSPSEIKTNDQYKMGDLSGKYGEWNDTRTVNTAHNDSILQMFGHYSLLGRSFVIHKKYPNKRWGCGSIERGYSPNEARELRAVASFHHPSGFLYGYIKMTQLVHVDGSKSDTVIEVNLRYAGKQNRNVTHNHFWLVYVNRVGFDAIVESKLARCTAAGYAWNPNFIQLADPVNEDLYFQECGPDQPYRCWAGDLSGRLGTISIGAERRVFSDSNLPLEGEITAIGKSIVILDKNRGHGVLSCANIEPDKDIIKYANIRKPPRFVLSQFLSDVRDILGAPEWMLTVDNRKTRVLYNGACIQVLFHFKGPSANELELDFSKLMRTGHLASPTISNPGYIVPSTRKKTLHYENCPVRDSDNKRKYSGCGCNNKINIIFFLFCVCTILFNNTRM